MQVAPIDVVLNDQNVVQPDVIFVEQTHVANASSGRYVGAPQLTVEVISPTSRGRDSVQKSNRYARAGITEFWLVDPELHSFDIYVLTDGIYEPVPPQDGGRPASVVLSGLIVDPDEIFAEVAEQTP